MLFKFTKIYIFKLFPLLFKSGVENNKWIKWTNLINITENKLEKNLDRVGDDAPVAWADGQPTGVGSHA
jgi:hypothetical protein